MTYPRIDHHGATLGVTGSCHQLWLDANTSLLIDCGLFQGGEQSGNGADADNLAIEFSLDSVQALIATHVHIDHIGRLPWLIAAGFKGPVHCTQPSALLMPTVLEDAFMVGIQRDRQLASNFIDLVKPMLQGHPYKEWITVIQRPDLVCRLRFQRAGHILGSAWVEFDVRYPQTEPVQRKRIIFSGDLGAPHAPLLPPPAIAWHADTVVLESTYGDRNHEDRRTRRKRFQAVLEQALADGGSVIIPAFSIGRTQELLYELEGIFHDSDNPLSQQQIPVILDAPLASRFTALYRQLKPYWDDEALQRVTEGRKPLAFDNLLTVTEHQQHLAMVNRLASTAQPAIVITGNGMCSAGRILNYLKAMLEDARHNVVFVGYQAGGTPGRRIQQQGQGGSVTIDGQRLRIKAGVHTLGGYSAHADQKGLTNFITRMRHWPSEVRLVHGDPGAKQALQTRLQELARQKGAQVKVWVP
ncbi:MAG: MBL fold metallo-hydrolase [Gammaproteobacteria bacterium]|nr:MBL fold metallo-hydrolase [Gammaproteobacteria bacterium]